MDPGCVIFGLLFVGGIVALVVWLIVRSAGVRRLEQRMTQVELEVMSLRAQLQRSGPPTPAAEPGSAPEQAATVVAPPVVDSSAPWTPTHAPAPAFGADAADAGTGLGAVSDPTPASAPSSPEPPLPPVEPPPVFAAPPPPAKPPRPPIEWERWIGVRGAAVLGAIIGVIAAALFLREAIERGFIPPPVRIAFGLLVGTSAVAFSERLRRRYGPTADALAGAGIVILYASVWAARNLYDLIPSLLAFALMALVTVVGGVLSWRRRSLVVALLGLVGGFATPLLIGSDSDNPIGLFGYLLLLNAGVAFLRRRIGWPWLSLLSFLASLLFQALWIGARMGPERVGLGLIILGAFAAFFAFGAETLSRTRASSRTGADDGIPFLTQVGALLAPFLFALYFASSSELAVSLWALLALLAPLTATAAALSRVHGQPALEVGIGAATLGVLVAAMGRATPTQAFTLSLLGSAVVLALVHLVFAELDRRRGRAVAQAPILVISVGVLTLSAFALMARATAEPAWLATRLGGWLLLAAVGIRLAHLTRRWLPDIAVALALGFALAVAVGRAESAASPPDTALAAVVVAIAVAIALQLRATWLDRRASRDTAGDPPNEIADRTTTWRTLHRAAELGAVLVAALPLAVLVASSGLRAQGALVYHLCVAALALCIVLAAIRRATTSLLFVALPLAFLAHTAWAAENAADANLTSLLLQLVTMVLLASLPLMVRRTPPRAPVWICAALYPAAWLVPSMILWEERVGDDGLKLSLMPLLLAALSLVPLSLAARRFVAAARTSALAWLATVALGLVAFAVPIALEREWLTVAWALQAFAVILLWRKLDHPGLKVFATLLFALVFVRLSPLNLAFLLEYPKTERFTFLDLPVLNWLLYTYGIPILALLLCARWLLPLEAARARRWEAWMYRRGGGAGQGAGESAGRPLYASTYAAGAILLFFFWLNLTIYEAFSPRGEIAIVFDDNPARDLTLSLGWGIYALFLLGLGMWRRSTVLRWISLAFLLLTFAKAFLYDLRQLEGLYRVGSLMALAISLLAVSLLYQRFVFRKSDGSGS